MESTVTDLSTRVGLDLIAALDQLEQSVLVLRFGMFDQPELPIEEIACRLHLHPAEARAIEKRVLRKVATAKLRSARAV